MPYYTGQAHEWGGDAVALNSGTGDTGPNDPSPAWEEMEKDRQWARLLLHGGERAVKAAGERYLPKNEGESAPEYRDRLKWISLRDFYSEAVRELVARMFAKPLVLSEDTHPKVVEWWQDIDDAGTFGDNFFQTAAEDAVGQGLTAILPDMPQGFDFASEAEEERAGVRPRLVHHRAEAVIEALEGQAFGMPRLARARLRRVESVIDGFSYSHQKTVREYQMGNPAAWLDPSTDELSTRFARFRTWTEPENSGDDWTVDGWAPLVPSRKATPEQQRLFLEPLLIPMYGGKLGFWYARPPMLQAAQLNRKHYRKAADIDWQEHIALVPTLDVEGADEQSVGQVHVGASRIIYHPDGSKIQWLTLNPQALVHAQKTLEALEAHIQKAALDPMQQRATSKQLATVRLLDESRPVTLAQAMLVNFQWAINRAVATMCAWVGVDNPGTITFQADVFKDLADPRAGQLLLELAMADPPLLAPEDLYRELQDLGKLDSDADINEMLDRLAAHREDAATAGL